MLSSVETIEIVSQSPLPVRIVRWQPQRSASWALTVICKATYELVPTQAKLAALQEPILDSDRFWDDDERRSVRAASDLAPFKRRAGVTLVGMAYAPPPNPARSFVARIIVGALDKSIEIFCDRMIRLDGSLEEGPRIARLPLHYERSAGGPETDNPVGVRQGVRDNHGNCKVPNLQPLALHVTGAADFVPPINFGPIAAHWPSRARKLGQTAATKKTEDLMRGQLPEDLDVAYFNNAPQDQQIDMLWDNERIVLDNLHPMHPHFVTSLPGLRPKVMFVGRPAGPQSLVMRPDTLAIDTERCLCTLTFRGQLPLLAEHERGKIVVVLEQAGEERPQRDLEQLMGPQSVADGDFAQTVTLNVEALRAEVALPFASGSEKTIAFVKPADLTDAWDPSSGGTMDISVASLGDILPFVVPAPEAQEIKAPALVFAPPPPAAPEPASPWVAGATRASSPDLTNAVPVAPRASSPGFSVPLVPGKTIGETLVTTSTAPTETIAPANEAEQRVSADAPPPLLAQEQSLVLATRAPTVLVWVDRKAMPRVIRKAAYQKIIEALEEEAVDPEVDDPALSKDPTEIQDKAHAHEILARAAPLRLHQLIAALERAAKRRGQVTPPIERCNGELAMVFDEFEVLRAMIAAARLAAAGKEQLMAVVKEGIDFLDTPSHSLAPSLAAIHTHKIREAFVLHAVDLPKDHLDTSVARGLAEQRKYQKRKVLGGTHLRALLHFEDQRRPVAIYIPATLEEELPLLPRFPVSLLVELHLPVDPIDEQPIALKAVAIARRVESWR